MKTAQKVFSARQLLFKEMFVGTLIYVLILGLFNDYTNIVYAKSFSTIFLAAIVLQILTYRVFLLKKRIVKFWKKGEGALYRGLTIFSVWFVLFTSKFVFIWAIDGIFGNAMNINGFFGILFVALFVTVIHKLADLTFIKLK